MTWMKEKYGVYGFGQSEGGMVFMQFLVKIENDLYRLEKWPEINSVEFSNDRQSITLCGSPAEEEVEIILSHKLNCEAAMSLCTGSLL